MKKIFLLFAGGFFICLFFNFNALTVAAPQTAGQEKTVKIGERLFMAQVNDIYINAKDYFGKTIVYEGIYKSFKIEETGETVHCVIRYGPGCCANDGETGFEVTWNGKWPEENSWCEAAGTLQEYEINAIPVLRLELSSLKVLQKRGAERVKM